MAQLLKRQVSILALMKFSDEMKVKKINKKSQSEFHVRSTCVRFLSVTDYNIKLSFRPCVIHCTHQPQLNLGSSADLLVISSLDLSQVDSSDQYLI